MRLLFLAAALGFTQAISAAKLTISIPPSPPVLPNPATLPSSTHAVLLGSPGIKHTAPLRRDNTFVFASLAADSYLLTIYSRDHAFAPYRVDITTAAAASAQQDVNIWWTYRGNEWSNKGPLLGSGQDDLRVEIRPTGMKDFYQQRGGFNLVGFLKSPMILMGLVSVVMIFGMPYLMENSEALLDLDPETKKEFEEMQKSGPTAQASSAVDSIQNFDLAGFLSGKSASSSGAATPSAAGVGAKKR
nr:hypothetical protein B0A51_07298 [Rachicladosporium sp. CCFEE 5018]